MFHSSGDYILLHSVLFFDALIVRPRPLHPHTHPNPSLNPEALALFR